MSYLLKILLLASLLFLYVKAEEEDMKQFCDFTEECSACSEESNENSMQSNVGCCKCISLRDCTDNTTRASCKTKMAHYCDKRCTCNGGYAWSSKYKKCLLFNDGNSECTTIRICYDQDPLLASCTAEYCTCASGAIWSWDRLKCLAPNNNSLYCEEDLDNRTGHGKCVGGLCSCEDHYTWSIQLVLIPGILVAELVK